MSEPIDKMEKLAGYVRDLRHAVEKGTERDMVQACRDIENYVDADMHDEVDNGIYELITGLFGLIPIDPKPTSRRVLGIFVAAIENLLELEASLR